MPPRFRPNTGFKRAAGAQPLSDLVAPCMGPTLARQGFGGADVLLHWPEIVGESLAEHCRPVKLQWRPRSAVSVDSESEPATLVVRVEGAFAVELQHFAPVVIERINIHFGWRCIGRLVLKQGPLAVLARRPPLGPPPDQGVQRRAADAANGIDDDDLRAALVALGSRVLQAAKP